MGSWSIAARAACCIAILSPAVLAPPALAQTSAADARMVAARGLADVLIGGTRVEEQVDALLGNMAKQAFSTDATLKALATEYPGVDKVFIDVLRPIVIEEAESAMPEYRDANAAFFAKNFTVAEIGELTRFWKSPTGQTLLTSISGALDYAAASKELVGQIGDSKDVSISSSTVDADKNKATATAYDKLTPAQKAEVTRFALTPTGRKMVGLNAEKNKIDHAWANRQPSPEAEARMEQDVTEAILAFIEESDRKRAERKGS